MSSPSDIEAQKALKHALRRHLFQIFILQQPLSPSEAADLVAEPLSLVSYHVRELVKYKFLILSSREPVRGTLKNYYVPSEDALAMPSVKRLLSEDRSTPE